jgi:hypothetical protein
LLRIKGELLLLQGTPGASAAEDRFRHALDWARRQGALSFELRAATSLARLWRAQGRPADALALLQPVYDRLTEGFDTSDLKAQKPFSTPLRSRRFRQCAALDSAPLVGLAGPVRRGTDLRAADPYTNLLWVIGPAIGLLDIGGSPPRSAFPVVIIDPTG